MLTERFPFDYDPTKANREKVPAWRLELARHHAPKPPPAKHPMDMACARCETWLETFHKLSVSGAGRDARDARDLHLKIIDHVASIRRSECDLTAYPLTGAIIKVLEERERK